MKHGICIQNIKVNFTLFYPLKIKYLAIIFINIFQSKDKNMYICKNYKSMEMTATDTFEKQDLFYNRMIEDYKNT